MTWTTVIMTGNDRTQTDEQPEANGIYREHITKLPRPYGCI
jgi:hypothetical protein